VDVGRHDRFAGSNGGLDHSPRFLFVSPPLVSSFRTTLAVGLRTLAESERHVPPRPRPSVTCPDRQGPVLRGPARVAQAPLRGAGHAGDGRVARRLRRPGVQPGGAEAAAAGG